MSPAQVRDEFPATRIANPIALQNVASESSSAEIRERGAFGQEPMVGDYAEAARLYPGLDTHGAEVMAADRSAFAGARGSEVSNICGKKVAARTVVVQMLFPRMLPSASLSESVVFAGRFAHGYRVWHVAH